jgi:hypothetical protein
VLSGTDQAFFESRRAQYREANVPKRWRSAWRASQRCAPARISSRLPRTPKLPVTTAARVYFGVGTALQLDWIREQIESLGVEGHWQAVARTTLRDNIYNLQRVLCTQVLSESRQRAPEQALQAWVARHQKAVDYLRQTVNDMRSLPEMDFATLVGGLAGCAAHGRRVSSHHAWKTRPRSSRSKHLEPGKPVHRLGRRRPDGSGAPGSARRRSAAEGGRLRLRRAFTSVLKRAIRTLWMVLDEMDSMWLPVERSWR